MFFIKAFGVLSVVCLASAQLLAGPKGPAKFAFAPLVAQHAAPVYHAQPVYHAPAHPHDDHAAPKSYSFEYGVKDEHTHDFKSQHEQKDGAHHVVGAYELVEPDGSKRLVNYVSDEHLGFHTQITKEGPYLHPDGAHSSHNFNLVHP